MGPTASGKSGLALALSEALDGEIVNADAIQVYADLDVLSARPSRSDTARAPHHLYGWVDGGERFSVGRWLAAALPALQAVEARGRTPIVVGGTGLYFQALTKGLAAMPAPSPALREALYARLAREGPEALHGELARRDPAAAGRLKPRDGPRILRALEILETAGVSITVLQARTRAPLAPGQWRGLVLAPPRARLYAAIEARFDAMLERGALEEAGRLAARGLDPSLPAMKAHGAPWLMAHLRGEIDLAAATALAKRDTRHYAKRQSTWIAHQLPTWPRLDSPDASAARALLAADPMRVDAKTESD